MTTLTRRARRPDPTAAYPLGRAPFRGRPNPAEALALDLRLFGDLRAPAAFGLEFDVRANDYEDASGTEEWKPYELLDGGVGVLCLRGPIEHHSHWYWTSFEDIACHIEMALADDAVKVLVLKIDSPGGVAAGMGETHRAIRRLSKAYGKMICAYVDEQACSAAYHVASACSEIWLPEAGVVGSVGVILCTVDETAALDAAGIKVRYVVTGKRKADLHPGQPVTDDVLKVAQEKVDLLGAQFFEAVGKARRVSPAKIQGLQAAVFIGKDAVAAGLADVVASWDEFLSVVRSSIANNSPTPPAEKKRAEMAALGRAGGHARAKKLSPRARSRSAKNAAEARWKKRA